MIRRAALVLALTLATASAAQAQVGNLDIGRFRPSPDRYGFLGIPGTRTPGPFGWNVALWTGYQLNPLSLQRLSDGTRIPIVQHRVSADFIGQIGLFDRVAVVVDVPMAVWQDANGAPLGTSARLSTVAVRDPYLATRIRILGDGAGVDHDSNEGGGLAIQLGGTVPVGMEHTFAGEGAPQLEGAVIGDFHFLGFGVGAIVGYRHRFAEPSLLGVKFGNELYFGGAIQSPLFFVENTTAILEVRVDTALDQQAFLGASTAAEGDIGVRWAEGDLMMTWLVGTGLTSGVGTPTVRGMYALSWAPRTHDADGDGITDEHERADCVRLPEDVDGFEDEDGCPDPDNDGDLVPDDDDRCPDEASDFGRDEDEDGCNDPVVDTDQDGIEDRDDACPRAAEDWDEHEDEDGCPDPDDDADGVPDAQDHCRDEAEDRDGFEDEDGCPDPDDDGDGVGDADDACPRVAEDRDGHDDADGCPDPDDDRDGVLDADDRCADQREDIDGRADEDGCPEPGGRALWRDEGEGDPPNLRGRIRFDRSGGIPAASNGAVDQLARQLLARWGARWTIAIPAGDEARVTHLREALSSRGVPAEQIEVVTDDALSGTTAEVRRVEDVTPARAPSDS